MSSLYDRLLKKDAKFFFQMHYTATGKAARDVSRMGLYFRKDAPDYQFRSAVMAKPTLKIPATGRRPITARNSLARRPLAHGGTRPRRAW